MKLKLNILMMLAVVATFFSCKTEIETNKINIEGSISLSFQDVYPDADNIWYYSYSLDTNARYRGIYALDFRKDSIKPVLSIIDKGLFPLLMKNKYFVNTYAQTGQGVEAKFCIHDLERSEMIWNSDSYRPIEIIDDFCYLEKGSNYYLLTLDNGNIIDFEFKGEIDRIIPFKNESSKILIIDENLIKSIDSYNGNIEWETKLELETGSYIEKVIATESNFMVFSSDKTIFCLSLNGELKWKTLFTKSIAIDEISYNNIVNNSLFVRSSNKLSRVNINNGEIDYDLIEDDVYVAGGNLFIYKDNLYFISYDKGFNLSWFNLKSSVVEHSALLGAKPINKLKVYGKQNKLVFDFMYEIGADGENNTNNLSWININGIKESSIIKL